MLMIDRDMPTCCEDCFAQSEYYNPRFDETEYSCGLNGENLGTHSRQDWGNWHCDRPKWCPLKEVKNGECANDITLMKEQETVIRCKYCKHYKDGFCYNPNTYDDEKTSGNTVPDWFCADDERR